MRLKGWIGSEIGLEYKTFCWGFMNKRLYKARGGEVICRRVHNTGMGKLSTSYSPLGILLEQPLIGMVSIGLCDCHCLQHP